MSKHTPGPWVKKGIHWTGKNNEIVFVSNGPAFGSESDFESAKANARLIAAAPELLEALEDLCECILETRGPSATLALKSARAAIAKAKGES